MNNNKIYPLKELQNNPQKLNREPPKITKPPKPQQFSKDQKDLPENQIIIPTNLNFQKKNTFSVNEDIINNKLSKYPFEDIYDIFSYEQYFISKYLNILTSVYEKNFNFSSMFDKSFMSEMLSKNHYCGNIHKAFMVFINSVFNSKRRKYNDKNPNNPLKNLQLTNEVQKVINDITLLSGNTAEGYVFKSSFYHLNDTLVLKISKDANVKDLIHEFFIGMSLNELKTKIPNFMYVYSLFNCSEVINTNDNNFKICEKIGDVNMMLMEKIEGNDLEKEMDIMDDYDVINSIFQICLALQMAYDSFGFIHQDLHIRNIMIRKLPDNKIIKYSFNNSNSIYINTNFYAIIIDYGFSAVYDENRNNYLTIKDLTKSYRNSPKWMNIQPKPGIDLWKFLSYICLVSHRSPNNKFNLVAQCIRESFSELGVSSNYLAVYYLPMYYDQILLDLEPLQFLMKFKERLEAKGYDLSFITNSPPKGFVEMDEDCKHNVDNILKDLTKMPDPEKPCSNQPWKNLKSDWKDNMGNIRYWFECGNFFFNGIFNVVKFPKGMSLYHGSGNLSQFNVNFPLGFEYYNIKNNWLDSNDIKYLKESNDDGETKLNYIENKAPIGLGYFGDYDVAQQYSSKPASNGVKCGRNCVLAYKLKKDAVFIDINDPYNIFVLLYGPYGLLTDANKRILQKAYELVGDKNTDFEDLKQKFGQGFANISKEEAWLLQQTFHPLRRFISKTMRRDSLGIGKGDYAVPTQLMFSIEQAGYAGLTSSRNPLIDQKFLKDPNVVGTFRFAELTFGSNVKKFLERDYQNKLDWQYFDNKRLFGEIGKLIKDFEKYKTLNVDYHQGDLLEHSIWTALYVQKQWENQTSWVEGIDEQEFKSFSIISGFLHDIGKGGDLEYIYYDKSEHPRTGFEYLTGVKTYKLGENKKLNITEMFKNINLKSESYQKACGLMILSHYDFGNCIKKINEGGDLDNIAKKYIQILDKYLEECELKNINKNYKLQLYKIIMLISSCDIMGSEVFINKDKFKDITKKVAKDPNIFVNNLNSFLKDFPYIHNRSKSHRGNSNYDRFKIEETGLELREKVVNILS